MKIYLWDITLLNDMRVLLIVEAESLQVAREKAETELTENYIPEAVRHNLKQLSRRPIVLSPGFDFYLHF